MKKLLGLLGGFSLIASTSASVVSCGPLFDALSDLLNNDECYDQNWKNVTDKESDKNQWKDIRSFVLGLNFLLKETFKDGQALYDELDGKTAKDIEKNWAIHPTKESKEDEESEGDETDNILPFELNFTLLITNYKSIADVLTINQMEQELESKKEGTYLFLNLPNIESYEKLQNETKINFQFLFLKKNKDGEITNNKNNSWFYWYDYDTINKPWSFENRDNEYFFDLFTYAAHKRVVTISVSPF